MITQFRRSVTSIVRRYGVNGGSSGGGGGMMFIKHLRDIHSTRVIYNSEWSISDNTNGDNDGVLLREELGDIYREVDFNDHEYFDEDEMRLAMTLPDLYKPPESNRERKLLAPPDVYTDRVHVADHTVEDWGCFYEVPPDHNIPEAITDIMQDEFEAVNGRVAMVRPGAWNVTRIMEYHTKGVEPPHKVEDVPFPYHKFFSTNWELDTLVDTSNCMAEIRDEHLPEINETKGGGVIRITGFLSGATVETVEKWVLQQCDELDAVTVFIVGELSGPNNPCTVFVVLPDSASTNAMLEWDGKRAQHNRYMSVMKSSVETLRIALNNQRKEAHTSVWGLNHPDPRIIMVDGIFGTGKSASLHYITQYACENGWLVLACRADTVANDRWGYLRRNAQDPSLFDQTRMTRLFLHDLLTNPVAAEALKKVKVSTPAALEFAGQVWHRVLSDRDAGTYGEVISVDEAMDGWFPEPVYDLRSKDEDGIDTDFEPQNEQQQHENVQTVGDDQQVKLDVGDISLYDFVYNGIHYEQAPGPLMENFMREVVATTDVPVLVVVDNVNRWDMDSSFVDPDDARQFIPCHRLSLVNEFNKLIAVAPRRGVTVVAGTTAFKQKYLPQHQQMANRVVIVPPYNNFELVNHLHHYWSSQFIVQEVRKELVGRVKAYTNGQGKLVRRLCGML